MKRRKFLIVGIICLILPTFAIYFFFTPNGSLTGAEIRRESAKIRERKSKTILYWTPSFDEDDWGFGQGYEPFEGCPYDNCYATTEKRLFPVEEFDALLFHAVQFRTDNSFLYYRKPEKRHPDQVYVFAVQESPIHSRNHMKQFNDFYNWTMTYRHDSDIFFPYDFVEEGPTQYRLPSAHDVIRRPKTIAWMVSNCDTQSKRWKIYERLSKFVEIDVYGKCGQHSCPRDITKNCSDMLERTYKFYLAFENSLCEEYVTEKLYNVLKIDLIPIVYGSANYTLGAPPDSVINVKDFKSTRDLVEYLKYLDHNPEEYLKFFEWKKRYSISSSNRAIRSYRKKILCNFCEKLSRPIAKKVYENVAEWWQGKNMSRCSDPQFKSFLTDCD